MLARTAESTFVTPWGYTSYEVSHPHCLCHTEKSDDEASLSDRQGGYPGIVRPASLTPGYRGPAKAKAW